MFDLVDLLLRLPNRYRGKYRRLLPKFALIYRSNSIPQCMRASAGSRDNVRNDPISTTIRLMRQLSVHLDCHREDRFAQWSDKSIDALTSLPYKVAQGLVRMKTRSSVLWKRCGSISKMRRRSGEAVVDADRSSVQVVTIDPNLQNGEQLCCGIVLYSSSQEQAPI